MSEFRRSRRLLMVVVLTAGALPGAWLLVGPSESTPDPLRAHRLLGARRLPTEERVALAIEATDRIRPQLELASVQRRLAEVTPKEAEIKAFYARNTAIFGGRSYSESRDAARRLVSIHQVRVGLGVLDPPATARFYAEAETD